MTPVFKSGNKIDSTNYRGICINGRLGKLFTAILNARLKNYVIEKDVLHLKTVSYPTIAQQTIFSALKLWQTNTSMEFQKVNYTPAS